MKIKSWLKIFGLGMVKNWCGQFGDGTLKLTYLKNEQIEWTDFLHGDTSSQELKAGQTFLCGHDQK